MTIKSKVPQIRFKGFSGEWEKNRLKELTEILRCGIAATPQYVDNGVVFLSSQNVTNSGKINLEKFNYISIINNHGTKLKQRLCTNLFREIRQKH